MAVRPHRPIVRGSTTVRTFEVVKIILKNRNFEKMTTCAFVVTSCGQKWVHPFSRVIIDVQNPENVARGEDN